MGAAFGMLQHPVSDCPPSMAPEHPADEIKPTLKTHVWFSLIWLIYLIDWADRFAISAVLPAIKQEFALSDTQLGLMSGSLFLGLALLAVPCGLAVDRFSRKYMITLMTLVWSAATWGTGLARSFTELVLVRVLVGAGEAGYNPAGYALIAAWYPARLRGTMVGLFNSAQPIGVSLGVIAAGYLAAAHGWRAVFGVLAIPGILLALAMLFAPDYQVRKIDQAGPSAKAPGIATTLGFIARNRTLQWIYLAQVPITFYIISLAIWAPTFFVRQFALSITQAASALGLITLIAGLGAVFGGMLSDRLARGNPRARVSVCLLFLVVPLVLHSVTFLGAMQGMSLWICIVFLTVGQCFVAANWGTLVAAAIDQSPVQYRASVQSFMPLFQALAALCAGVVSGMLSDAIGLTLTLQLILLVAMLSAMLLLNAARASYDRDHRLQQRAAQYALELDK